MGTGQAFVTETENPDLFYTLRQREGRGRSEFCNFVRKTVGTVNIFT